MIEDIIEKYNTNVELKRIPGKKSFEYLRIKGPNDSSAFKKKKKDITNYIKENCQGLSTLYESIADMKEFRKYYVENDDKKGGVDNGKQ